MSGDVPFEDIFKDVRSQYGPEITDQACAARAWEFVRCAQLPPGSRESLTVAAALHRRVMRHRAMGPGVLLPADIRQAVEMREHRHEWHRKSPAVFVSAARETVEQMWPEGRGDDAQQWAAEVMNRFARTAERLVHTLVVADPSDEFAMLVADSVHRLREHIVRDRGYALVPPGSIHLANFVSRLVDGLHTRGPKGRSAVLMLHDALTNGVHPGVARAATEAFPVRPGDAFPPLPPPETLVGDGAPAEAPFRFKAHQSWHAHLQAAIEERIEQVQLVDDVFRHFVEAAIDADRLSGSEAYKAIWSGRYVLGALQELDALLAPAVAFRGLAVPYSDRAHEAAYVPVPQGLGVDPAARKWAGNYMRVKQLHAELSETRVGAPEDLLQQGLAVYGDALYMLQAYPQWAKVFPPGATQSFDQVRGSVLEAWEGIRDLPEEVPERGVVDLLAGHTAYLEKKSGQMMDLRPAAMELLDQRERLGLVAEDDHVRATIQAQAELAVLMPDDFDGDVGHGMDLLATNIRRWEGPAAVFHERQLRLRVMGETTEGAPGPAWNQLIHVVSTIHPAEPGGPAPGVEAAMRGTEAARTLDPKDRTSEVRGKGRHRRDGSRGHSHRREYNGD